MKEPTPITTDAAPSVVATFNEDGSVSLQYHAMTGILLAGVAAVLSHESEKLLFQQDVAAAQAHAKNGGRIVVPGGRV